MSNPTYALAILVEKQNDQRRAEALRAALLKALDAFTEQCDEAIAKCVQATVVKPPKIRR